MDVLENSVRVRHKSGWPFGDALWFAQDHDLVCVMFDGHSRTRYFHPSDLVFRVPARTAPLTLEQFDKLGLITWIEIKQQVWPLRRLSVQDIYELGRRHGDI